MKTITIKHVDGKTNVKAKVFNTNNKFSLEWKFQGMDYGRDLSFTEAVELGLIKN